MLELHNIQAGVLRPRLTPYAGAYIGVRIDDHNTNRLDGEVLYDFRHRILDYAPHPDL